MKKVLVTGGAGFIGSHTVDLLLQKGIPARVLDNFTSGRRSNLPDSNPQLEIVEGDITNQKQVGKAFEGVSHCLHLAAQVSVIASLEDPLHSAMQNIIGFVNVLAEAQKCGVERLVYASSAAIYGEPEKIPLPEDISKTQLSPYGLEKNIDEEYAALFRRIHGMSSLGLRYFNVYGPRQDPASPYAGVIAKFSDCITTQTPITVFGDGKQTRDFIFVGDVARTNVAALTGALTGACNVGTSKQTSLLDLINVLTEIAGMETEVVYTDPQSGDIRDSLADTTVMNTGLGVIAKTPIHEGLRILLESTR